MLEWAHETGAEWGQRMTTEKRVRITALWLICFAASGSLGQSPVPGQAAAPGLNSFFVKKRAVIAVTDSGLGGLSVMAEAARRMKGAGVFEKADLLFFNALFSAQGGYNSLGTREEKILVFDSALRSLEERYRPDIVLIGCNTLSVLYGDTPFSKEAKIPVIGIVSAGLDLIGRGLRDHPEASVIIFGTPTTIAEGSYPRGLDRLGFAPGRILSQACPELESFIERDHRGDETEMLIAGCVSEALQKIAPPRPPLIISLNCTHYGYALPLWERAFAEERIQPLRILNPNTRMVDPLFDKRYMGRFKNTEVSARVVSMVEVSPSTIGSLEGWLEAISPEVAGALRRHEHVPELFEWEKFVSR